MLRVKQVKYLSPYKLKLTFSDGKTKVVDFEDWILEGKGYLKALKNVEFFKKVHLDEFKYTICWPNGADFCPDVLYEVGEEISSKTPARSLKTAQKPLKKTRRAKRVSAS